MKKLARILAAVLLLGAAAVVLCTALGVRLTPRRQRYVAEPLSSQPYLARATSADSDTRAAAVAELARRKDPAAVPVLAAVLKDDKQPGLRAAAACALGSIGRKEALPALADALKDRSELVYRSAFWAVGQLRDPAAVELLCLHLHQTDDRVRAEEAAWALRHFPSELAEPPLIQRLEKTPISHVSLNVAASLACVGTEKSLPALRRLRLLLPRDLERGTDDLPSPDRLHYDLAVVVQRAIADIEARTGARKP